MPGFVIDATMVNKLESFLIWGLSSSEEDKRKQTSKYIMLNGEKSFEKIMYNKGLKSVRAARDDFLEEVTFTPKRTSKHNERPWLI